MELKINLRTLEFTGIMIMGISISILPGIVRKLPSGIFEFLVTHYYFFLIVFFAWKGNIMLIRYLRRKNPQFKQGYVTYAAQLFLFISLYTFGISFLVLSLWKWMVGSSVSWDVVLVASFMILFFAILTVTIYEIINLNKQRERGLEQFNKLKTVKDRARLENLKKQIDPHFLFNSLNTLSALITDHPADARLFNDTLATIYRYIVANKEKDLVPLSEELELMTHYFRILQLRYGPAILLELNIEKYHLENFYIPPVSLQELLENAVKHNSFSLCLPLKIILTISNDYITVKNSIQNKIHTLNNKKKSGTGLSNLGSRLQLISGKTLVIQKSTDYFLVKLPLIR
ncbi:MAG: histidine kinase [Chitinophagaceae bacterium]|nr:histidine kinase [Chitinophagaceae bacterium]